MTRIFTDPRVTLIDEKWRALYDQTDDPLLEKAYGLGMIEDLHSLGYSYEDIQTWNEARRAALKARH